MNLETVKSVNKNKLANGSITVYYEMTFLSKHKTYGECTTVIYNNPFHKNHEARHCHEIKNDFIDFFPLQV